MGGPGAGHKSWRARQSRLRNIQKARAARKRAPLPWRSGLESRIIEQLVWQWFLEVRGSRLEVGGELKSYKNELERDSASRAGRVNPAPTKARNRPWAKYRVARLLGVSHTWVNKLVKRFEADPARMRRKMAAFASASFEKLERAREETRRQREMGWLRGPIRVRRVKVTLWGKKRTVTVATRAEKRRWAALRQAQGQPFRLGGQAPPRQGCGGQAGAPNVRHQELPLWARGLLLPGDSGTTRRHAVPFAFRRRRW